MRNNRLIRDLALVLAVKVAVLYGLWVAFFSQPASVKAPTATQVSQALIGTPAVTVPQHCKETRHDC